MEPPVWMSHPCKRPNAGGQLEHALNLDHLHCNALQCIGEQVKILLSHLHAGNCLVQRMFSCCPGFSGGRVIQDWWKVQRSTKTTEYPELQRFSLFQWSKQPFFQVCRCKARERGEEGPVLPGKNFQFSLFSSSWQDNAHSSISKQENKLAKLTCWCDSR